MRTRQLSIDAALSDVPFEEAIRELRDMAAPWKVDRVMLLVAPAQAVHASLMQTRMLDPRRAKATSANFSPPEITQLVHECAPTERWWAVLYRDCIVWTYGA